MNIFVLIRGVDHPFARFETFGCDSSEECEPFVVEQIVLRIARQLVRTKRGKSEILVCVWICIGGIGRSHLNAA